MRVFISAPFEAAPEANTLKAQEYADAVFRAGHLPFLPHGEYDWTLKYPRRVSWVLALYLCCKQIETCDELWYFGEPSEGMRFEIRYANGYGVRVRDGEDALRGEKGW